MDFWKAGVAKTIITPEMPLWLAGYSWDRPSKGKLHDLWAKALALEDAQGRRGVIVTADILGLSKPMYDRLSAEIERRYGLNHAQTMLTNTHNHSSPVLSDTLPDYYPLDEKQWKVVNKYTQWLEAKIVEIVGEALARLAPAKLFAGEGMTTFAVNRRNNKEAEIPKLLEEGIPLKGPVDHSVPVLAVRTPDDRLTAIVFGYACHTTVLNGNEWCGDYAGFAQLAVKKNHPEAAAMFWAGCGGDQNPLPRRKVELCEKYGNMLAQAVEEALQQPMRPLSPQLRTAFAFVTLDFDRNPTREELLEAMENRNAVRARWAKRMLPKLDAGEPMTNSHEYAVQVWRLGDDQLWIALGGEAVVDYSLRFKREFGPHTWVVGYAHDMVAYIPSRRVWEEGGYEGGYVWEYGFPANRLTADVEDRIAACVHRLVEKIGYDSRRPL